MRRGAQPLHSRPVAQGLVAQGIVPTAERRFVGDW